MSDPQTNIEIEDVLASIRRLVSEGQSDAASDSGVAKPSQQRQASIDVPVSAPALSANTPAPPEKLVLLPDQMVEVPTADREVDGVEPLVLTSPEREQEPVRFEHREASTTLTLAPEDRPPLADMWHLARGDNSDTAPSHEDVALDPEPLNASRDARSQLLSTIAELEAAVTSGSDDFEPDGSEQTPVVDWAQTTANGAIFGSRAATTRIAEVAAKAVTETTEKPESQADVRDQEPSADVEDHVDDDLGYHDEYSDDEQAGLDDEALSEFLNTGTTMDEAALRALVTDIVRQELQGALGERITRNVRKLVRREIYRALASEEFN